MKALIVDIETDGLDNATKIHCCVCRDLETQEYWICYNAEEFRSIIVNYNLFIGHNIVSFDWYWLRKIWGITLPADRVKDTLILSQLLHQGIEDGHSLEAWGQRLGVPKVGTDITDFSVLTLELEARCIGDTKTNCKLYSFLNSKLDRPEFKEAIDVEHRMAFICLGMHLDGFKYDKLSADILATELNEQLRELDAKISTAFKPKAKQIRVVTPRRTKNGTLNRGDFRWYKGDDFTIFGGGDFTLFRYEEFNPNSNAQLRDILDSAGWNPVNKTKTGRGYKIDEVNTASLPEDAPESARLLVRRLLLAARTRTLATWASAYSEVDKRIHGRFNTLGTYTHRASHTKPNLGNIAAPKSIKYKTEVLKKEAIDLGTKMRNLWICDEDNWLVGTDAKGIQLRIFGHHINDKAFIDAVVAGDPHSLNASILNITRDSAKTFIYAFLLGAGDDKISEITGGNGHRIKKQFIEAYPGLDYLKRVIIPRDAKRKFCQGFDGRLMFCDSEHLMMGMYLQGGEAILLKHANVHWRQEAKKLDIPFRQVVWCHDEWVTEVSSKEEAEKLGELQREAIKVTGERFNLNAPFEGETKIGKSWLECH